MCILTRPSRKDATTFLLLPAGGDVFSVRCLAGMIARFNRNRKVSPDDALNFGQVHVKFKKIHQFDVASCATSIRKNIFKLLNTGIHFHTTR